MRRGWAACLGEIDSKRREGLKICAPEAQYIKETDFDIKTRLAPSKFANGDETFAFRNWEKFRFFIFLLIVDLLS